VQDADEAVAQSTQCLVVHVAGGAVLVIEGAGAGAGIQCAEGPLVDRVVEAAVADVRLRVHLAAPAGQGAAAGDAGHLSQISAIRDRPGGLLLRLPGSAPGERNVNRRIRRSSRRMLRTLPDARRLR